MSRRRSGIAGIARTWLVAVAAIMVLGGCGILPKKEPVTIYAPEPVLRADPSWPQVGWQLVLPRPTASELLDSSRIAVRPAPGEMQVYKAVAWSETAPDLVYATVLRGFEDSGRITGVSRRGGGIAGDFELHLDLRRFDADYVAGGPVAVVEVGLKLVGTESTRILATHVVKQTATAGSTDTASVAKAFETALGRATSDIVGWTLMEGQRHAAELGTKQR
ncbi:MAG TPA: ABC-type transport auxiliary lipoprotein family protein [Xanthomonadaceae bacterium]|nr:ABC-type transport auxiliary lipoprotein family protein [Xanthomonadaceae bacterium]